MTTHQRHRRDDDRLERHAMLDMSRPRRTLGLPGQGRVRGRGHRLQDRRPRLRPSEGHPAAPVVRDNALEGEVRIRWEGTVQNMSLDAGAAPRVLSRRHPPAGSRSPRHSASMCGPQFCSMTITDDVVAMPRSTEGGEDALEAGPREKAGEFASRRRTLRRGEAMTIPAYDEAARSRGGTLRISWARSSSP